MHSSPSPCYRTSGEAVQAPLGLRAGTRPGAKTRLAGRDEVRTPNDRRNSSAHDFKQYTHASGPVKANEHAKLLSERTADHPHALASRETPIEATDASLIDGVQDRLHDAAWDGHGRFVRSDEPRHSKGSVHRAPAIAIEIERDEQISRESGSAHMPHFARVANRARYSRKENAKALSLELRRRARLAVGQGSRDVPSLACRKLVVRSHSPDVLQLARWYCGEPIHAESFAAREQLGTAGAPRRGSTGAAPEALEGPVQIRPPVEAFMTAANKRGSRNPTVRPSRYKIRFGKCTNRSTGPRSNDQAQFLQTRRFMF